jgi:hypothetical protein
VCSFCPACLHFFCIFCTSGPESRKPYMGGATVTHKSEKLVQVTMERCGFDCVRKGHRGNARWGVSKVVDKHTSEPAKLPFLADS